jgi:hypothetical protein
MKIIIRDSKGGYKTIKISPNKKVSDLKDEIENENKSKNNIELIFNGMILENDYTLDELGIQEGNTIDYIGIFLAGLNKY